MMAAKDKMARRNERLAAAFSGSGFAIDDVLEEM
jgi:hypothetical protein